MYLLALTLAEGPARDDTAPSPEAVAFLQERRQAVLRALNELREEDRLVIAYRYFLDLSEGEMAEALCCPRGTVKSRLSRALGRLKHTLLAAGMASAGESDG